MRMDFQVGAAVCNEEVEDGVEEETGFYHIPVPFIQLYLASGDCTGA